MLALLMMIHVLVAIVLVVLVMLQHGKGADIGATFGGGASNTVFGSQGSAPFLAKLTGVLLLVFFASSLGLGYLYGHRTVPLSTRTLSLATPLSVPAAPTSKT